jgi:hypothetical protein
MAGMGGKLPLRSALLIRLAAYLHRVGEVQRADDGIPLVQNVNALSEIDFAFESFMTDYASRLSKRRDLSGINSIEFQTFGIDQGVFAVPKVEKIQRHLGCTPRLHKRTESQYRLNLRQ